MVLPYLYYYHLLPPTGGPAFVREGPLVLRRNSARGDKGREKKRERERERETE